MSSTNDTSVGARLLSFRESRNISQQQVADSVGVSLRAYQNYERGNRSVSKDVICALMDKYDIDPTWLLSGKKTNDLTKKLLDKQVLGEIALQFEIAYKALEEKNTTAAWLIAHDLLSDEELQQTQPKDDEIKALYEACQTRYLLALLIGNTYNDVADIEDEAEKEKEIRIRAMNHAMFLKNPHLSEKIRDDVEKLQKKIMKGEFSPEEKVYFDRIKHFLQED